MQYGNSIGLQHFIVCRHRHQHHHHQTTTQMMFILLLTQQKFELIPKSNCIVIYFTKNYVFHTTADYGNIWLKCSPYRMQLYFIMPNTNTHAHTK